MPEQNCFCGHPLHYINPMVEKTMHDMVALLGENVKVTFEGRTWEIPRHYIALHGLKGKDVPNLGFKEIR